MTPQQRDLLRIIERHQADNDGASPSFAEMRDAMGLASNSGIERLILSLEECGAIRRARYRARRIEILAGALQRTSDEDLLAETARRGWVMTPPATGR